MKRWQDRGEVEDSEDDELSLEPETQQSQTPERPRKRAKHASGPDASPDQPRVLIPRPTDLSAFRDGGEIDWMQPMVAKTYGRKPNTYQKAIPESRTNDLRHGESESERSDPVQNTPSASRTSPEHVSCERQITTSRNPGDLPDLNTTVHLSQHNDDLEANSSASSPLSERDVSPPPGFESPTGPSHLETAFGEHPDLDREQNLVLGSTSDPPPSTAFVKRNLRARKAIQLAPYQFDKAQYTRLCHARGIRPVRLVEQNVREEAESQSQPGSSQVDYSSSVPSSPVPPKEPQQSHEVSRQGLDYFDLGNSPSRENEAHRLPKRRKLGHNLSTDKSATQDSSNTARSANAWSQIDEFSLPPSPPRTSSDLSNVDDSEPLFRQTVSGFRIPLGLTPAPLPTPQISSDVKRDSHEDTSSDSPPRRPRVFTERHGRAASSTPSNSESESEQDSVPEVNRLQRERKRIKGVLPASWLKIDLQAQLAKSVPEASRGRRLDSASPVTAEPQKGVARKIGRAIQRDQSPILLDLSGGTSDSDDSVVSRRIPQAQTRLDLQPDRLSIAPDLMVDEDLMENDFVDPMLPSHTRQRNPKSTRAHQPRIDESFRKASRVEHDLTKERRATTSSKTIGRQKRVPRVKTGNVQRRKPAVHLSIADVITSPHKGAEQLPHFIRLALRRTKYVSDQGRHSPTHKFIRLATAEDTKEASLVLRAWRQGTIAPRRNERDTTSEGDAIPSRNDNDIRPPVRDAVSEECRRIPGTMTPSNSPSLNRRSTQVRRMRQTRIQAEDTRSDSRDLALDEGGEIPPARTVARTRRRSQRPHLLREAQLETLERDFDEAHREAMFERRMQCMTENVARSMRHPASPDFQLDRFLWTRTTALPVARSKRQGRSECREDATTHDHPSITLAHRPRKSRARRLDVETREYRQPIEPIFSVEDFDEPNVDEPALTDNNVNVDVAVPILHGLSPYGTQYSTDFDMRPLDPGMFFHHSTFIGSDDFRDALSLPRRDLDHGMGHLRIQIEEQVFEWDVWNEDVATQVNRVPDVISYAMHTLETPDADTEFESQVTTVERNVSYLLRSVVRYLARCVWFTDQVDRKSCVEILNSLVSALSETWTEPRTSNAAFSKMVIRALQYQVVIAKQAALLSDHPAVPVGLKTSLEKSLLRLSGSLAKYSLSATFIEVRSFYEDSRRNAVREPGIQDETSPFASLVLLRNTLVDCRTNGTLLWRAVSEALHDDVASSCDVRIFEALWQKLFTILPALEVNVDGAVLSGSRFRAQLDDWSLIKALVSRVLELYDSSSQIRGYSVNAYVRAVLCRCHCLINQWGWWRCEPVLNAIFDFFARRSFNLLHKEEPRGSPKFLDELHSPNVDLEATPDDCSFHIFLKMVASGVSGMRKHNSYADRKIISIIWRFIPNHNRMYRKDMELHKADLDALRNQHDLFSVLYYASPTQGRIGVDLVLGLVDHSTSHREACRLSVRAWANIACFQASSIEPVEALQQLVTWFSGTIKTTFAQYRLAKSEAEQDFQRAKQEIEGAIEVPTDDGLLETTIASNQRHIAAIIFDALAGLKRAVRCASSLAKVQALVDGTQFVLVFELFDSSQRRLLGALQEALLVCEAALDMQQHFKLAQGTKATDDDSQDFGDISAIEAFVADDQAPNDPEATIADTLLAPLGQFLSNIFGADTAAEDSLLQHVIDVWARLANVTVRSSARSWSSYVDDYGTTAWNQLRDTTQKRKFTPYFTSQIIVRSSGHEDVREAAVVAWMLSLVEREAMLKFQHCLTSALLNLCGDEPMLSNLPFTTERSSDRYDITLADFRQRRLGLISSVLHNMRAHHDEVSHESARKGQEVRSRYAGMLRQLMQAMKSNYQDLQSGQNDAVANASLHGGYVDFVQNVVSFLQQYALGICQVDRFFTDSTAFPLPATDPTYVVGRLRSYIPRLSEASGRTQLAMFIQTVSERAATDNQQQYLINQIAAAMGDVEELGDDKRPSLRHVLLTTIFPVYVEKAILSACFWIPAIPILEACGLVINNLFYNFQIEDNNAVLAVVESLVSILHSVCLQCDHALVNEDLLRQPRVLRTLASMFNVGHSCLTISSCIQRTTSLGHEVAKRLQALQEQAITVQAHLQHRPDVAFYHSAEIGSMPQCPWPDTRAVAEKQVRESVDHKWHAIDGQYFIQRGNSMKEVVVELRDSKEEKARLLQVIASFCRAYEATFGDPQQAVRKQRACDNILRGLVV